MMLNDDVLYMTVDALGALLRTRKISPVELTESWSCSKPTARKRFHRGSIHWMGRKRKGMKKSPHSHHEQKAGVTEQELIETFERVVREDYPNPERVGCPSQEVLEQAAASLTRAPQSVLDHIAKCAPCLQDYDRHRSKATARNSGL